MGCKLLVYEMKVVLCVVRKTYGAGRYLDINKVPGSSSVLLDFNKAYNPYCAYSDNFSCPFPPKQNILGVPIRAGEKTYH